MANDKTTRTWIIDTAGILTDKPVLIQKAVLYLSALADAADFRSWDPNPTPELTKNYAVCTVTGTNQIVSTGNFPTANVDPGDVITISRNPDTGKNLGSYLILTNTDNNTITLDAANALTNEASKHYDYKIWTPVTQFRLLAHDIEKEVVELDFSSPGHAGRVFPNLLLDGLSASAIIHLFIG